MTDLLVNKLRKLQNIKKIVEEYNIEQQEAILNIIKEGDNNFINENKNGFFINLTNLHNDIITKIEKYMEYIVLQENHLTNVESQKKEYEQILNT